MKKARTLGIRQSVVLATGLTVASTLLGAAAMYGYRLNRRTEEAERLRIQTLGEAYAAQAVEVAALGRSDAIQPFVDALRWHPDVCLLAVLDERGEPLAVRGHRGLLKEYERHIETLKGERPIVWDVPGDAESMLPKLKLAAVPIRASGSPAPLGWLVCAARVSTGWGITAADIWVLFAGMVLIAATGMILGTWWLSAQVLEPLAMLARHCRGANGQDPRSVLPTYRKDEIGELARILSEMHTDVDEWKRRTAEAHKTIDHRVSAETQRITRELREAQKRIWTDPLTRLGNRRLFDEKFAEIFRSQSDAHQDLSLCMIDVDNFKSLNDSLGHKAGDDLLEFIGELLRQCLREQDLAIRYGGDEFVLILPSVDEDEALSIADRTIRMFAQQTSLLGVDPKPTMSAGITSLKRRRPGSAEELLEQADQALYAAKKAGKSRVKVYEPGQRRAVRGAQAVPSL